MENLPCVYLYHSNTRTPVSNGFCKLCKWFYGLIQWPEQLTGCFVGLICAAELQFCSLLEIYEVRH